MEKIKFIKSFIITFVLGVILLNSKINAQGSEVILFHSPNCGHCITVNEYIDQNSIESKVNINYQDVTTDESYNLYLEKSEAYCNMSSVSTPMLFVDDTCLLGSTPVIEKLEILSGNGEVSGESSEEDLKVEEELQVEDEEFLNEDINNEENVVREGESAESSVNQEQQVVQPKSANLTVIDILIIIIAPVSFLTIVYLLIKKLQL